jgi:hypothetical protein
MRSCFCGAGYFELKSRPSIAEPIRMRLYRSAGVAPTIAKLKVAKIFEIIPFP